MKQPGFTFALEPVAVLDAVLRERDDAMAQVEQHAEDRHPGFQDEAMAFVVAYLRGGPASGEAITNACKLAGIVPHDDRAFGPVYMALAKQDRIEKVGTVARQRGHGTAGGNLWALKGTATSC